MYIQNKKKSDSVIDLMTSMSLYDAAVLTYIEIDSASMIASFWFFHGSMEIYKCTKDNWINNNGNHLTF